MVTRDSRVATRESMVGARPHQMDADFLGSRFGRRRPSIQAG